jgi:NADH-quinone oxidoreductase subunit G
MVAITFGPVPMEEWDVEVVLNGKKVPAKAGERLVEIIGRHGLFPCAPCYDKYLSETGHCDLCIVGVRQRETDRFTMVRACTATAKNGMEINTEYAKANLVRRGLLLSYLLDHPMDCSMCDKVGNCFLHKFSSQTKFRGFTRIVNGKLEGVVHEKFGTSIAFDREKCIGCRRCVRFYRDIIEEEKLSPMLNDKARWEVDLYPGKTLDDNYSLNVVDLCPAGAMVNEDCTYQPAAWDLIHTESISTESSVGINTHVLHKNDRIFRIIPRENAHVNGRWMTNSARREHLHPSAKDRLREISYGGACVHLATAAAHIIEAVSNDDLAIVCSGKLSLEDQFALRRFSDTVVSSIFFLRKTQKSDGFLLSSDATPNFNGALLNGLVAETDAKDDLQSLNQKILAGGQKKIMALDEDIFAHGISKAIDDDVEIFYMGTEKNATARRASVVIPTTTVFESTGTFVNGDWRLQKFHRAVDAPNANIFPMWYIFSLLLNVYHDSADNGLSYLNEVWKNMADSIGELGGIDFKNLPSDGIRLKKC